MFSKLSVVFTLLTVLTVSDQVLGRYKLLERDGRFVALYPRRFGQEQPAVIGKLSAACPGQVCGVLAGAAITPLLAAQPECSQQDMADQIIDAAQQFDETTKQNMINLAIEYRQAEKNTPPDFTTNPPTPRNSVFCQKAPKNSQLNGLVQAQDPANSPDVFFDPATKATVKKGDQPNTFPFGTNGDDSSSDSNSTTAAASATATASASVSETAVDTATTIASADTSALQTLIATPTADPCVVTVTVTPDNAGATSTAATGTAVVSVTSAPAATSTADPATIGNFGKCTVPQIEFAVGFDNRKETSFQPADKTSYPHGSAQAIGIITQFICDTLTNSCGADATAKATCAKAQAAVNGAAAKTGGQADLFNAEFGILTNFAAVQSVDDQGRAVAGTGSGSGSGSAASSDVAIATSVSATASAPAATSTGSASTGDAGALGNFGKCSVPQIEFGTGFDGRKESSFQPTDKNSYNHDSAQNGAIITQFICDTLVNSCGADATARATCQTARTAFDSKPAKTGAQADAFNAVFNIQTNFAALPVVDNQGNIVSGTDSAAASATTAAAATTQTAAATTAATSAASATTSAAASGNGANLQTFTGSLGGVAPPTVFASGSQFQVTGNSAFNSLSNALTRSCDVQHNQCANAANASGNKGDLTVAACGDQQTQCNASHQ